MDLYKDLEDQFVKYADLVDVPVTESQAAMALIDTLSINSIDRDMRQYTGDKIYVRAPLLPLLEQAQCFLQEDHPNLRLQIVYGYRHISIQTSKYRMIREQMFGASQPETDDMREAIHRYIAVPEVSGHPTGGAVDLHIIDADARILSMGTDIHAFEKDSYVFSPAISDEAKYNRKLLRDCMTRAGFAPFDGEWWHFSYGDREWAFYYDRPTAIFSQIEFTSP